MKIKKILNNEGFTIVETMIVLAIAGLILLIVLLAVPALQRQSTNTNVKSDAEAISSAINDFESNNAGFVPSTGNFSDPKPYTKELIGSASGNGDIRSVAKIQPSITVKPELNNNYPKSIGAHSKTIIYLSIGYSCSGNPNSNQIAIYYPIEVSSGKEDYSQNNCLDA